MSEHADSGRPPRRGRSDGAGSQFSEATGLSRPTIQAGLNELRSALHDREDVAGKSRKPGGGRKPLTKDAPELLSPWKLVDPGSRGDPMSPLLCM